MADNLLFIHLLSKILKEATTVPFFFSEHRKWAGQYLKGLHRFYPVSCIP